MYMIWGGASEISDAWRTMLREREVLMLESEKGEEGDFIYDNYHSSLFPAKEQIDSSHGIETSKAM